jgi:hypothetical protein
MSIRKPSSIFDWLLLALLGIFLYEFIKQIQAAQSTGDNLITSAINALGAAAKDIGAIVASPFAALSSSPSSIGNAITGAGASISAGITSGISSGISGIFSSLWSLLLWLIELPFVILGNIFGLSDTNLAAGAFKSTAGAIVAAASSPPPDVTAPAGVDPTIDPVPASGANTISNGGGLSTDGNFSVVNGAGASSTGFQ